MVIWHMGIDLVVKVGGYLGYWGKTLPKNFVFSGNSPVPTIFVPHW